MNKRVVRIVAVIFFLVLSLIITFLSANQSGVLKKLRLNTPLVEPMPVSTTGDPTLLFVGQFVPISIANHTPKGHVMLFSFPDGKKFLRIEDLVVQDPKNLHVYISWIVPNEGRVLILGYGAIDLGPLKGSGGAQNYEIPRDFSSSVTDQILIYDTAQRGVVVGAHLVSAATE